jgi:hypothetical protein
VGRAAAFIEITCLRGDVVNLTMTYMNLFYATVTYVKQSSVNSNIFSSYCLRLPLLRA